MLYTLFDTRLGQCGIVWRNAGSADGIVISGFQLPEATPLLTEARIAKQWNAHKAVSVPASIQHIIEKARRHFDGEPQDFADIAVDLEGMGEFAVKIYRAARAIPAGRTMTYGALAAAAGCAGAARGVGQAMSKNLIPLIIPCHRVLAADGGLGGFSAHGGLSTKAKMLELEGVSLTPPVTIRSASDLALAAASLSQQDPRLAGLLSKPLAFKLSRKETPYHILVKAVVHQQLAPKAAQTILGRVIALYGHGRLPSPAELLATEESQLRSAGLSRAKTRALKDIAKRAADGTIPTSTEIKRLSDGELVERLTSIYGIGQWTVEMMLIFSLGRIDVLPADDYALRAAIGQTLSLNAVPTRNEVLVLGEQWRPYRTVAALGFWQVKDGVAGNAGAAALA